MRDTAGGGGGTARGGSSGRGVGYFELEQRLSVDEAGAGSDASSSSSGGRAPGITLKVYGDVWRWLVDGKVCALREQVVEARFSLVHVTSVARKAVAIAQVCSWEVSRFRAQKMLLFGDAVTWMITG